MTSLIHSPALAGGRAPATLVVRAATVLLVLTVAIAAAGSFLLLDRYVAASRLVDAAVAGGAAAQIGPAYVASINLLTLLECGLALMLVARAGHRADIRALALLLAFLAVAEGEFFYPFLRLGAAPEPLFQVVLAASALALAALLRFSALFPRRLTVQDLEEAAAEKGRSVSRRARVLLRPGVVWGGAAVLAWLLLTVPDAHEGWPMLVLFLLIPYVLLRVARYLRVGYRLASPPDRRRALWVVQGCLAALAVFVWSVIVAPLLVVTLPPDPGLHALLLGIPWDRLVTPTLVAFLALAVLYDGGADPALAIQKTAIYGALGLALVFLFAGLENVATDWMAQGLGLPPTAGTWIAGGFAAIAMGSLKDRVEDVGGTYLERVLPSDGLALAPRRNAVVVSTSFSVLSTDDEQLRLTLLSLLHRAARRTAKQFRAATLVTIADFVILEFADSETAARACSGCADEFRRLCEARGLERSELCCGVQAGCVVRDGRGGLFGGAVSGADSLRRRAAPGEVLLGASLAAAPESRPIPAA